MLKIIEIVLALFFIYLVIKEIMVPWWQGGRAFPRFRKRHELEGKRAEVVDNLLDVELERDIQVATQEYRKQLKKIRRD